MKTRKENKMNKGYEFDLTTNEFRMTESFARKASQVGTPEYQMILKVKRDHPQVTVKKIVKRKSGRGLNYDMMLNYIRLQENAEDKEKEFDRQKRLSRVQPMPYRFVLNWFDDNYPDYYDWLEGNETETASANDQKESYPDDVTELREAM